MVESRACNRRAPGSSYIYIYIIVLSEPVGFGWENRCLSFEATATIRGEKDSSEKECVLLIGKSLA